MSRPTAEIEADLRIGQHFLFGEKTPFTLDIEAADRLAELDAFAQEKSDRCDEYAAELEAIDALRPPCPTCGGTGKHSGMDACDNWCSEPCPDCVDGKVSIERMAKVFAAVHDDRFITDNCHSAGAIIHLRGIR